ncbi:MAG TPA: OmpA family protein [Vicinamibacterales bacterium]|nr:OmpA family protein [Vicinamibacterales bacterium]
MPTHTRRPSHERWLVSYADFITLLFAFFAMLYASSRIDAHKLQQVSQALQVAFDKTAQGRAAAVGTGVLPERGSRLVPSALDARTLGERMTRALASELQAHQIEIGVESRGLVLSIPEAGTFSTGSDQLSPTAEGLISRVASVLADAPNQVRVEGHTDDVPIHTWRFNSNWDLSTARATRVVEFLSSRSGIAPARLSAAGYGEFHPRAPNDTPISRARNRRVDIVVLNDAAAAAEEPGAPIAR